MRRINEEMKNIDGLPDSEEMVDESDTPNEEMKNTDGLPDSEEMLDESGTEDPDYPPRLTRDHPPPTQPTPWLDTLRDYLESIIVQDYPTFTPEERKRLKSMPKPDNDFLSHRPSYYDNVPRTEEEKLESEFQRKVDQHWTSRRVVQHPNPCKKVCRKYGTKTCRFNYPRPIVRVTGFKNGVIQLRRLDTNCNNYNRALLSVLRSNMDVKFITNGQDARATIFYITDYVTKSELSVYECITMVKLAVEKIERNEYPRTDDPTMTEGENRARQRIFTCLNVLDSNVERSGQWVATVLLGLPLEYSSHPFQNFSSRSFVNYVDRSIQEEPEEESDPTSDNDPSDTEGDSNTTDVINNNRTDPSDEISDDDDGDQFTISLHSSNGEAVLTNQRIDYLGRTSFKTDRYLVRPDPYLHTPFDSVDQTLAQMSPLEYVQRVRKTKMTETLKKVVAECKQPEDDIRLVEELSKHLSTKQSLYGPLHPQRRTHIQTVSDCSNPKVPHTLPVLVSYTFPSLKEDPLKFYITVLSLLTPYQEASDIIMDPDKNKMTFKESYEYYLDFLSDNDRSRHTWLTGLLRNLRSVSEGRDQQKLDRLERERLKKEQGLTEPVGTEDGYDYNHNEVKDDSDLYSRADEIIRDLPTNGPCRNISNFQTEIDSLGTMKFPPPAMSSNQRVLLYNITYSLL